MKGKVRISEIAQRSGVSAATVSLVLNQRPGVSPETRARVLQVAGELGYALQNTRPSLLSTVGMVVKTDPETPPQANPFYSKVILGIEDVCRRSGINLLFATLPVDDNNHPVEIPQLLFNPQVDGLLMVGTFVDETITLIAGKHPAPLVLVDGYSNTESYDAVVSDNFRAAYQAVEYLLGAGHRHIGLVGSEAHSYPSLNERRNGYLRALKDHQINETYLASFNISRSSGYEETLTLLAAYPQITALFCINDNVASAAIKAIQSLGKCVPQDISVIGYDDTYIAANLLPSLTTLHVDTMAMGRAAVHLLALRVEHPASARTTLTIHPWLVERDSTGPAPTPFQKESPPA